MTREQLAELIDVDIGTIWRWETGKSLPEEKNIESVAKIFGVSPREIAGSIDRGPAPTAGVAELARELTKALEEVDRLRAELAAKKEEKIVANHIHDKEATYQYHGDDISDLTLDLEAAGAVLSAEKMKGLIEDLRQSVSDHLDVAAKAQSDKGGSSSRPAKKKDSRG